MALILIVEDEEQVLVLADAVFKDAGHETLLATSYDGAVALLSEGRRPDLAFIDRNLGEGLTGIDFAREARRAHPDIQVLYTSDDLVTDGMRAMFVERAEYLPKPYSPDQIIEAANALLARSPDAE